MVYKRDVSCVLILTEWRASCTKRRKVLLLHNLCAVKDFKCVPGVSHLGGGRNSKAMSRVIFKMLFIA